MAENEQEACGHPTSEHDCAHDCPRLWCRLSKREPIEPVIETFTVGKPSSVKGRPHE